MTGVERNSQQVAMAAFAPLLSHWNDRACPHNMIIFDNHRYKHIWQPAALPQDQIVVVMHQDGSCWQMALVCRKLQAVSSLP